MQESTAHLFRILVLLLISKMLTAKLLSYEEIEKETEILHREKRQPQLIYPNTTLLQFNVGVGTPTPIKTININWVFQANFQLPWNRTQIPSDILYANSGYGGDSRVVRMKRDEKEKRKKLIDNSYRNDARLYHFYRFVVDTLNGFGYNGTACVLKTLCDIGKEPLHCDDDEDILHEIAAFVLNPNNDIEDHDELTEEDETYHFVRAFNNGHNSEDCSALYDGCSLALTDMFTKLHDNYD